MREFPSRSECRPARTRCGNALHAVGTLLEGMERTRTLDVRSLSDGIGILGSALCAVHCIATPVVLASGAALPAALAPDETIHRLLLLGILPAALLAFGLGCRGHKDRWVLLLGIVGMVGLSASVAVPHDRIGEIGERALTFGSSGLLIAAHVRNVRRCRVDCCHQDEACGAPGR